MNNKARDQKIQRELEDAGWKVIVVWECQLKKDKREETLNNLLLCITNPQ